MAGAIGEKQFKPWEGGRREAVQLREKTKKSKGAVWFDFGWEEDQRTGGGSSWWNQLGEKKKIRAGGGGGPLGEDKLRSFLGFFLFCVISPSFQNPPPFCLSCGPVFIGKILHGSQNWSLNFFFL